MKSSIIQSALIAAALLLSASLSVAAETKPGSPAEIKSISGFKAADKSADSANAAAKVKLVDINSAGKTELKALPGITEAEVGKIIAGRPYLSKANLLTQNIVSEGTYKNISSLVMAKPTKASEAKLLELQKQRQSK